MIERLERELEAIERAEQRVEEGTYGISVESGEPIPDGRLEAIPWAERTAEEQARLEAGCLSSASVRTPRLTRQSTLLACRASTGVTAIPDR